MKNIGKLTPRSDEENWKSTPRSDASSLAEDSKDLFNLITKAVMQDEVKHDLCRQSEIEKMLFDVFVPEHIK